MSIQRREQLVGEIVALQPLLGAFVRDLSTDLTASSWDMVSYSFQRGFEALWDLAWRDTSGLLDRPLLSLWRQSVELAIKSSILDLKGRIDGRPGHGLDALFAQLLATCADAGVIYDDALTVRVTAMIARIQAFDPLADRFRYPEERGDRPYVGIAVDLDELFQAHWMITTWCEGAIMEIKGDI